MRQSNTIQIPQQETVGQPTSNEIDVTIKKNIAPMMIMPHKLPPLQESPIIPLKPFEYSGRVYPEHPPLQESPMIPPTQFQYSGRVHPQLNLRSQSFHQNFFFKKKEKQFNITTF